MGGREGLYPALRLCQHLPAPAIYSVIIHHSGGLHVCVADGFDIHIVSLFSWASHQEFKSASTL